MKAMIFAAGLGTRLKPLTDNSPKALIPVAGKPILEHLILKLKDAGYNKVVINVHHFADQILHFLEANQDFGIEIEISDETDHLLDTGGGLEKASQKLMMPSNDDDRIVEQSCDNALEDFDKGVNPKEVIMKFIDELRAECYLIHNVDIISNCDLESLNYYHQHSQSSIYVTLLVSKRITSRYLLFDEDDLLCGWVNKDTMETKPIGFEYEEGKYNEYAYSGIQVVSPLLFEYLPKGKYSIIDFYLSMCHKLKIQCFVEEELQLIDIGKPETLEKAEEFLNSIG